MQELQNFKFGSIETIEDVLLLNSQLASLIAAGANDDLDLADFKDVLLFQKELSEIITREFISKTE